jgi:type IV secretion system protein VirD4
MSAFAPVIRAGWIALGITWLATMAATLGPITHAQRPMAPSGAHGTAAWGTGDEFLATGLAFGRDSQDRVLRYAGEGHLLTVAPTRSGKGVSVVIPTLLTCRDAAVVTDPKGENFAVTARARRDMGHHVHALDPFDVAGGASRLNPLDAIDPASETAHDAAWGLADMIVLSEHGGGAPAEFWNEEARALLAGLILHVLTSAPIELRHLPRVRELITLPPDPFRALLAEMQGSQAAFGLVSRAAMRLMQKEDRERSGVISSAQNHTHFLDSPRIRDALTESTFSFREFVTGPSTCYLILPPSHLRIYRRWVRLMLGGALQALTEVRATSRRGRVLFLLDEIAHLGRLRQIEDGISLAGGYLATGS